MSTDLPSGPIDSVPSDAATRLAVLLEGEPDLAVERHTSDGERETVRSVDSTTLVADNNDTSDRVRGILAELLATDPGLANVSNRELVNLVYDHIYGESLLIPFALRQFLELAADAIRDRLVGMASASVSISQSEAKTDLEPAQQSSIAQDLTDFEFMSLIGAPRNPALVLSHHTAWLNVRNHIDADQAVLYALTIWAGRTARELADLFDCSLKEIRMRQVLALDTVARAAGHEPFRPSSEETS